MKIEKIIVASGNEHKVKEIREIFSETEIVSLKDLGFDKDIEETGNTFAENAFIKAEAISKIYNCPVLSDDSGLCVEALGGAPGIFSARFSGKGDKGNRDLLLKKLEGEKNRRAFFQCSVCLFLPNGDVIFGDGKTYGKILTDESGSNGFGYDCLFFSDDLQKSFGLASAEEKNSVSHRKRALQDLISKIK